nr:integrase, catalytic region, zinc finger, CCHC-type, peptidase aspartic, catalytic [Tanacetum cinerariifolium]
AHLDYLRHLKESVETIRDIVEEAKVVRSLDRSIVSACRYTQHSQKLLEYAIGTCPQGSQQRPKQLAHTPLIRKKQVTATKPSDRQDRVKRYPKASGSQPKSNHKTNRISPTKGANKLPVEDLPRTNKSHPITTNRVDSSSRLTRTVVQIVLWYLDSGCSKHMTGDRSRLLNFVKKFIGTVQFGNDHFGAIMGYGDYVVVKASSPGVFGALCYPTNDSEDLGKLQPTADTRIFVGYAPSRKCTGPAPTFLTPGHISSGLVPNPVLATPYAPPPIKNWRFYFNQCLMNIWNLLGLSDQILLVKHLPPGVVAEPHFMKDHNVSPVDNNPFVNVFAPETHSEASSSGDISSTESPYVSRKKTQVWKPKQVGKVWKPTGKVLTTIGHQWRPTGWILHLGTQCPLTRFTPPQVVSATQSKKHANTYANQ